MSSIDSAVIGKKNNINATVLNDVTTIGLVVVKGRKKSKRFKNNLT